MSTPIEYRDLTPSDRGWHPVDVLRAKDNRKWDWVALLVDVPLDQMKNCVLGVEFMWVDPDEYRPDPSCVAREVWVRIPGKHRNQDLAWDALQDLMAMRH
jgi:hypothetical protein